MSEGNNALRLREAEGVGVVAVLAEMVASSAIVTILSGRAVPDRVLGLELTTEAATVGEWSGSRRTTGLRVVVVVLRHGVPPDATFVGVGNGCC